MNVAVLVLVCFAAAAALPWLASPRAAGVAAWTLDVAGSVLAIVTGARVLAGQGWSSSSGLVAPLSPGSGPGLALRLDDLGGLFLLLVGVVAVPALLVSAGWWVHRSRGDRSLPSAASLLLLACFLVVAAADVWTLLIGWEALTLSFYWLTMAERRRAGRVDSALAALSFGKFSGASLAAGLLLLAASSGSLAVTGLGEAHGDARTVGYVLLLLAFAVKVGLVPVHVWLPRSYAAAPGPVRALLAGVAVNVGFYGSWRTLEVLGPPPPWLAVLVMLLGGVSALIGIAHAAVQTRLTGIVAWSSVENAGLILAAFGLALVGAATSTPGLAAAGLLAATLQVVAHALGKTLLFTSAGVVEAAIGSDVVDELRGVSRVLPWSGTGLAVGAVTMAGLPPFVVFVSEWFILEALMQQFRLGHQLGYALPMAVTGALVALTAGFAGVAFIRLVAFTSLGRTAPGLASARGRDAGWVGRVGLLLLIVGCVGIAASTPWEIAVLARGLGSIVPRHLVAGAVTDTWVLGPVYHDFSVLAPSWLALELPILGGLVLLMAWLLSRRRMWQLRTVEPWRSATGGVTGADEYTPFGYANPTRHVLANVLLPHTEVRRLDKGGGDKSEPGAELAYRADVVEVTEAYFYRPLRAVVSRAVTLALRLQSGRLDAYLLYMLLAVVAVIALVSVTG